MPKLFNKAVFLRELNGFFKSPIAYFFILGFLLLNIILVAEIGQIFNIGKADISAVFSFYPWLLAFFVPAAFMRIWAEEFKTKTYENLISLPIDISAIIGAKFIAGLLVLVLAILAIVPFIIYLKFLGPIDLNQALISIIATLFLGSAFLSIAIFASSLTDKEIIAYLIALLINITLLLIGYGINYGLNDRFALLSVYNNFNIGLFGVGTLSFIFIILTGLLANYISIKKRINKNAKTFKYYIPIIIGFLVIAIIPDFNWDLSKTKAYSIKPISQEIIKEIKQPISLELYYSKEIEDNPEINALKNRLIAKLNNYKAASRGKISIEQKPFSSFSALEEKAINYGLIPLNISDKNLYFGLIIKSNDKITNIPYFIDSEEPSFEYFIIRAINAITKPKPRIAIIADLPNVFENSNIVSELRAQYDIINLPKEFNIIPNDINALIIANPYPLNANQTSAIKEYTGKGGKAFFSIDPLPLATGKPYTMSNLNGLMNELGFTVSGDIIGDKDNAIIINSQNLELPQPLFMNIEGVNFIDIGALDIDKTKNSKTEIIAQTSELTQKFDVVFAAKEPSPQEVMANTDFEKQKYIIAARLNNNISIVTDTDYLDDNFYIANNIKTAKNADFFMNELENLIGQTKFASLRNNNIVQKNFYYFDNANLEQNESLSNKQGTLTEEIKNLEAELLNANPETSRKIRAQIIQRRETLHDLVSKTQNTINNIKLWSYIWGLGLPFLLLAALYIRNNKSA